MPGVISVGKRYPLLSPVLVKEPHILPDNIHYAEQMECYKQCLRADPSFKSVVQHDLAELKNRLPNVESKEKHKNVEKMIACLERLKTTQMK